MIDEIKLFRNMIKYHPTIIGWLIKEKKVEKLDKKLVVYKSKKHKRSYLEEFKGEVYLVNDDGSKRISSSFYWNNNFTQISLLKGSFKDLSRDKFSIFDIGNRSERHCLTYQLEDLIKKHYDILGDIMFPEDYPRLKGESATCFIKWMEQKHNYIVNNDYNFGRLSLSKWGYLGISGFSDSQPEVIDNIKKYGIFAYQPVYERIEWTFELVEKYKDSINWKCLMQKSNLEWKEEDLLKYETYIPFTTEDFSTYWLKFNTGLEAYDKFGFLSNKYLDEHKDRLDWRELFKKGKFHWNAKDLFYFCNYVLNIDMPYGLDWMDMPTTIEKEMPYFVSLLLLNENFEWDKDSLETFLHLDDTYWDKIMEHPELYKTFLAIPNVYQKAQGKITKEDFWETVEYNHDFPYNKLSKEFNIETIGNNINEWSKQIQVKFLHTERTPDTNYSYYWVRTKWDDICNNINIPLTYELALYLKDLEITIGGTYCESDGGTIEEDHRWLKVNALRWCSNHHIENKEEIEKIISDKTLLPVLLNPENSLNTDIVKYMCKVFFKRTTIQQYLDIVNNLKNWDSINKVE